MDQVWILVLAIVMDLLIGDPLWLPHPIRWMGFFIQKLEKLLRVSFNNLRLAGFVLWITIISGTLILSYGFLFISLKINFIFGLIINILMIFYTLAIKSLTREGKIIRMFLKKDDLTSARNRLQTVVSRDCAREDKNGIIRGTIETLTENLSDGIIAPVFFAAMGGGPLALTYKAVNTLDSMVGYKNEKYEEFGWFSARADDLINLVPARLTGVLIFLTSCFIFQHPIKALKAWIQDAQKGPSPNGGIPIVTFAGARDIALGGDCYARDGSKICIPIVGGQRRNLSCKDIWWANFYIYFCVVIFLLVLFIFFNSRFVY